MPIYIHPLKTAIVGTSVLVAISENCNYTRFRYQNLVNIDDEEKGKDMRITNTGIVTNVPLYQKLL